jgi:hypothetical protein
VSLGIVFKGAEGIVLAADSRVTLTSMLPTPVPNQQLLIPITFDNATKLLSVKSQTHVGAVTFGAGSIGQMAPRTAASFMPEFEDDLADKSKGKPKGKLSVEEFATALGVFFNEQWTKAKMPNPPPPGNEMVFLVGGYDVGAAYGRIFTVSVPNAAKPVEFAANEFGATWGGQRELTDRLLQGFDPNLAGHIQDILKTPPGEKQRIDLEVALRTRLQLPIPWQFLPLQDCVDLCILLIRTTIQLQQWMVSIRGVGGAIDVATITRTDGFKAIQIKELRGEFKADVLTNRQDRRTRKQDGD